MVVFGQKCFFFGQIDCIRLKPLFSGKVVVFGQNWFYSGNLVIFGQSGCIRAKWLYSGKVVVFVVVFGPKW